jgi:hypothetical protein
MSISDVAHAASTIADTFDPIVIHGLRRRSVSGGNLAIGPPSVAELLLASAIPDD